MQINQTFLTDQTFEYQQKMLDILTSCYGRIIKNIVLISNQLIFTFNDDSRLILLDDGNQCCEERFLTTDDDLSMFIGDQLVSIIEKDFLEKHDTGETAECLILEVQTNKGFFSFQCHNIHNGYYSGFNLTPLFIQPKEIH